MPNKHIITQLIAKLDEYLGRIKFLQKYTKEEFLKDWQIETQIDRMLQLVFIGRCLQYFHPHASKILAKWVTFRIL